MVFSPDIRLPTCPSHWAPSASEFKLDSLWPKGPARPSTRPATGEACPALLCTLCSEAGLSQWWRDAGNPGRSRVRWANTPRCPTGASLGAACQEGHGPPPGGAPSARIWGWKKEGRPIPLEVLGPELCAKCRGRTPPAREGCHPGWVCWGDRGSPAGLWGPARRPPAARRCVALPARGRCILSVSTRGCGRKEGIRPLHTSPLVRHAHSLAPARSLPRSLALSPIHTHTHTRAHPPPRLPLSLPLPLQAPPGGRRAPDSPARAGASRPNAAS